MVDNRSRIDATVLKIITLNEYKFYLRLQINNTEEVSGYQSFAKVDNIIDAYPNFKRKEGENIDYSTGVNKHLLQALHLKKGDKIGANIYYRKQGVVLLLDWKKK